MKVYISIFVLLFSFFGYSQKTLSKLLKQYNDKGVPYISVQELASPNTDAIILDAREPSEFEVSHIEDATCVGYNDFDIDRVTTMIPDKDKEIVVYCSLGIRSESIGEKLKRAGYTNVKNLYGGIFEWKNNNFEVYNSNNKTTDSVHAFSKEWSKWLKNGIKVYSKTLKTDG
ncbi:rhodanese-like domain-containing protein [Winogradskyella maritima]|uniref:Rhodanese-like domain-containing protein n=1 Tax=Winogradskyella maritima TaxID=1517766 RepID=A0ABV8AJK4_9FLAO|nr:rhodanese-like domain-containing protein [Winogradskyella maritima]